MSNMLNLLYFTCIFCHNSTYGGKMVIDGPGKAQVRSGLQRIFAQSVTNNPGREDRAMKPELPVTKQISRSQLIGPYGPGKAVRLVV